MNLLKFTSQTLFLGSMAIAINPVQADQVDAKVKAINSKVVEWRRDIHQHPELSNREFRTQKKVAAHLKSLGLEVDTSLGHTGVVAILKGGKPGPVVGLRADMDALPVTEQTDVPFKSVATSEFRGEKVGVMHACGHDTHVAILMGVAEILVGMKDQLKGSVMFVFQPAEEGAPEGEEGGAELMLKQGLFKKVKPDAMFGLHMTSGMNTGMIGLRSGPLMASSDRFEILVKGRQTHGSRPWGGVDPIVTAAQIIMGVQTIASRQVNVTKAPSVISFGLVKGGIRNNIIPDEVQLVGTIRNFDMGIRNQIHKKLKHTAEAIAESAGAKAEVEIDLGYPVTVNSGDLYSKMLPSLHKAAGKERVIEMDLITGAEDFSYYAQEVPGMYFFLGGTPWGKDPKKAPSNHSPLFYVDEKALPVGVEALTRLTLDYMGVSE